MDGDEAYMSEDGSGYAASETVLEGAPIEHGALDAFLARRRHIYARAHPYLSTGIAWITGDKPTRENEKSRRASISQAESRLYRVPGVIAGNLAAAQSRYINSIGLVFHDFHSACDTSGSIDIYYETIDCSRRYRQLTADAIDECNLIAETEGLDVEDEKQLGELYDTRAFLQLTEAIYLPDDKDLPRCDALMEWVNSLDPQPSKHDGEEIMMARVPCEHPDFWDYICKGVVRGLFNMVAECLTGSGLVNGSSKQSRATDELVLLLRSCPRISMHLERPEDYKVRYRNWRSKVLVAEKHLDVQDHSIASSFRNIYELLKGDKDAIFRQCDTWQETLAALALLFDPTGCKAPKDICALFELSCDSNLSDVAVDVTLPAEAASAALCEDNVMGALAQLRMASPLAASLAADLLSQILESMDDPNEDDLTTRDRLVLELGDKVISEQDAWQSAFNFWRTCGDMGINLIEDVITRIPLQGQSTADALLAVCTELELLDQASEIETVWGKYLEQDGQHGEALNAYDRAGAYHHVDCLSWSLFRTTCIRGEPTSTDPYLAEALQSPSTTRSREISTLIAPYATLVGYHFAKAKGDLKQMAVHIAALLSFAELPREYVPVLMAELLPVLNAPEMLLSHQDVFAALAALEDCQGALQGDGLKLLQEARASLATGPMDWRSMSPETFSAQDILDVVRLKVARYIGRR